MLHPLLHLLVCEPQKLADHLSAYADLSAAEWDDATAACRRALLMACLAVCALVVAVALAGVALMLWAVTPGLAMDRAWLLLATPGLLFAAALWCWLMHRRALRGPWFATLREQLGADLLLLK
jgi:sterol desaturase/sphingolipid hydroxylase (fatty acid hydroxylase superfamily)